MKNEIQLYIVQSRYYAAESDTGRKNIEKLKAEVNSARREITRLRTELAKEKGTVRVVLSSFSFQLGNMLIQAIRKPGRNTILLPYRVLRLGIGVVRKRVSPSMPRVEGTVHTRYRNNIRIALYADANMNLIDGSSVWTASLVEALAGLEYVEVFLFLKSKEKRSLLTEPLKKFKNVNIISPDKNLIKDNLTPEAALDKIEDMDRRLNFDAIVLRRFSLCEKASLRVGLHGRLWTYLTDIPQKNEDLTPIVLQKLDEIARASKYILCQTEEFCG